MSPKTSNITLNPLPTIISNSTTNNTNLTSPTISSRDLYHETFGPSVTANSLPGTRDRQSCNRRCGGQHQRSHHYTKSENVYPTTTTLWSPGTRPPGTSESNWCFGQNLSTSSNKNNNYHSWQQLNQQQRETHKGSLSSHLKMTGPITTEEEFDALPIAVRRKFFSTLERLRFAQSSSTSEDIKDSGSTSYQSSQPRTHNSSIAGRRGLVRRVSLISTGRHGAFVAINSPKRKLRKPRTSPIEQLDHDTTLESPRTWFMALPEKIQQSQFSREEQIALAGSLREGRGGRGRQSVILDAADEAVCKASFQRQVNRAKKEDPYRANPSPLPEISRSSMEKSVHMKEADVEISNNASNDESDVIDTYDSFRWLDEESELDLRLDDYHANLPGSKIHAQPTTGRHPSFRRRISISKLPFGSSRTSFSTPASPIIKENAPSRHWAAPASKGHEAKRSRTLSMLSASRQSSTAETLAEGHEDPTGCYYYQDPDARLKLRVYLASPQKFDEAIEFGFPSLERDCLRTRLGKETRHFFGPRIDSRESLGNKHVGGEERHETAATFFYDEDDMEFGEDDDTSMDPDSPQTPQDMGETYHISPQRSFTSVKNSHARVASKGSSNIGTTRTSPERSGEKRDYLHLGITRPTLHKRASADGFFGMSSSSNLARSNYVQQQIGPGNREMTLRMTLTRPDLRSDMPPNVSGNERPLVLGKDRFNHGYADRGARIGIGCSTSTNTSTTTTALGCQNAVTETTITAGRSESDWEEKFETTVRGPFGGPDGWDEEKTEGGVVKRFWKKVKHPKKA